MNKILKLMATLFVGGVIAIAFSSNVKAEPVYYVNDDAIYITSTENPYYSVKLPSGTAIPANSLVVFNKKGGDVESALGLLIPENYNPWTKIGTFRTSARSIIEYGCEDSATIGLNYSYNYSGAPGDMYLYNWKAQQEAQAAAQYADYLNSFVPQTPCWGGYWGGYWNVPCDMCWNAPCYPYGWCW